MNLLSAIFAPNIYSVNVYLFKNKAYLVSIKICYIFMHNILHKILCLSIICSGR